MRVILITGKGGVGKTTVAAATAIAAADLGHRTLVMSTDPAHSLGDAFDTPLGDSPSMVVDRLDAQQIDSQMRLEDSWGAVRDHLTELFDWSGLKGIEAVLEGVLVAFGRLRTGKTSRGKLRPV